MKKDKLIEYLKGQTYADPELEPVAGNNDYHTSQYKKGFNSAMEFSLSKIDQLEVPELPVIPQFVADYFEGTKFAGQNFYDAYNRALNHEDADSEELNKWFNSEGNYETFARAWLDGYTIEKEPTWVVKIGKGYFSGYDELTVTYVLDDMPCALDRRIVYDNLHEAETDADNVGGTIEPLPEQEIKSEPPKTRQVLVNFFDNEEYKTELTEEAAKELIEFLEANKNE